MTTQPTALRPAGALSVYLPKPQDMIDAAAELRRLYEENGRLRIVAEMSTLLLDQRSALLEALKELTGHANERFTGGVWDRARAAIKAVEGETK